MRVKILWIQSETALSRDIPIMTLNEIITSEFISNLAYLKVAFGKSDVTLLHKAVIADSLCAISNIMKVPLSRWDFKLSNF